MRNNSIWKNIESETGVQSFPLTTDIMNPGAYCDGQHCFNPTCSNELTESQIKHNARYCSNACRFEGYKIRKGKGLTKKQIKRRQELEAAAERWTVENWHLVEWLIEELQIQKQRGWRIYSFYAAWESLRFHEPPEPIPLDNRFRKVVLGKVLEAAPDLRGFLKVRG